MTVVAPPKLWVPRRALITPAALDHEHGRAIAARCEGLGVPVERLAANRLSGLRGNDDRETYRRAKSTLAVVVSPPSDRRLQPIPPSADWQFHLARGCPAHCQYCYLAGSLQGPPVTRAYADVDAILGSLPVFEGRGTITSAQAHRAAEGTTFEASCYTDPLGIEHLTGSLARAIEFFGSRPRASLRFTTKFDHVEPLLGLDHGGRTRARFSVNSRSVERLEGGAAPVRARLEAMRRMALAGYPVGLTIAPIVPRDDWRAEYGELLDEAARAVEGVGEGDLTVELITHRFTPGSKEVLTGWYPATRLEMDEEQRVLKRGRFGSRKHVYPADERAEVREFFEREVPRRLGGRILYFT